MARRKDRGLSREDLRIWRAVADTVAPLPGKALPPQEEAAPTAAPPVEDKPRQKARTAAPVPEPARPRPATLHELDATTAHGIDHRMAQRFKRGQLPIDAHLDLHGMTRERAHDALNRFLATSQARGDRCIVVVTGKGQKGPLEPHTGVLKATLPRWLNDAPNRARVLAFAPARPQHGGAGAFYVLLKRNRPER